MCSYCTDDLVLLTQHNNLELNLKETKELVVRMRWTRTPVTPISIHGVCVETVEDYKYLSVHMGNKLDFIKKHRSPVQAGA